MNKKVMIWMITKRAVQPAMMATHPIITQTLREKHAERAKQASGCGAMELGRL